MASVDAQGNLHDRSGRYAEKQNSAPAGGLAASATSTGIAALSENERRELAREFLEEPAPDGYTHEETEAWNIARADLAESLAQQPLSYVAFLAQQRYESLSRRPAEGRQIVLPEVDYVAERLHELAGTNRYPNRNPEHVGDDTRTHQEVVAAARGDLGDTGLRILVPVGASKTRAALKNTRGEADGGIRRVRLTWDAADGFGNPLEITGPRDGRPILVDIDNAPILRVVSGHAIIRDRGHGTGISVGPGAKATVISSEGRKTSITAEEGSHVDFYVDEDTRGYQSIATGSEFRMHGTAHSVTLSSDRKERPA